MLLADAAGKLNGSGSLFFKESASSVPFQTFFPEKPANKRVPQCLGTLTA